MLYMFLSAFSAMLLAMYLIFKKTKHLFKESTLRKTKKISLIFLSLFFAFYFLNMAYGDGYLEGKGEITEKHNNTFPISYWYRNKAYSTYRFTYKKTDSIEGNLGGAYKVRAKITWEFKNFRWGYY